MNTSNMKPGRCGRYNMPAEHRNAKGADSYQNPGQLRQIPFYMLSSGADYQRQIDNRAVQKLVRNWNPVLLDPLVVSYRDGSYHVVDGQHRLAAIQLMNAEKQGMGALNVLCIVHTGLTYADEASLCYELDKCRKKLTSAQSINALLQSGENAEINEIKRMLDAQGFQWALDNSAPGDYKIRATRAVIFAYRLLGPQPFPRLLVLLSRTWHGAPASLTSMMFSGMARFLKTYETQIKDENFITRLQSVAPETIIRRAKSDLSIDRNDLRCARALVLYYNKAVRGGRKLSAKILC